jgi:long-subunit acyl-CoA synthetase (AMP-forming)
LEALFELTPIGDDELVVLADGEFVAPVEGELAVLADGELVDEELVVPGEEVTIGALP